MDRSTAIIISSLISAVIALIVVFVNRYFERKKIKKEKYDAIKRYANPIIHASEQLAWRLKEILEFKGPYLLPDAPMNGFFKYKFDSTVYRLCALLGWIQAAKKEQSYFQGSKVKHHEKIQNSLIQFQKYLADGSQVEVSISDDLSKIFNLKTTELDDYNRALIGVELEKIIFKYIPDHLKKNAVKLDKSKQVKMVEEIMSFITSQAHQTKIKASVIQENIETAINEISREFCWIYRDWQAAIGDEMIEKLEGADRRFEVIGFANFCSKYPDNQWLKKVGYLFEDLDVSIDDKFDSRVQQLKKVFIGTVNLIETFKPLLNNQDTIPASSLDNLKEFSKKLNSK